MQRPQEMQHQQRSPGPPAGNNKGGNLSVTPTRKTRRGKRGGRGRSVSPRSGLLPSGAVGVGGGRGAGWFPNHQHNFNGPQLGHGSSSLLPPAPPFLLCQQQQQQQQREQRKEPPAASGPAMAAATSPTAAWGNQVFADPLSTHWNNTGRPLFQGALGHDSSSPMAHHPGEGDARPGGRGGGAIPGRNCGGMMAPPSPGATARVEGGLLRRAVPPLVLAARVQKHLHALAHLFFDCSKHGERPSVADMAKAQEQLRGASDLMLELQQRLVEAQPQAYPRPAVRPHGAPSRLPREKLPQEAFVHEEQASVSAPPGNDVTKRLTSAWKAEPGMLPAGNLQMETQARGTVGGLSPGAPRAADCEWQGGQRNAGVVRGAVEAGGDGELRNEAFYLCPTGRTEEYIAAAAATKIPTSPRPGTFLPLSIEVGDDAISTLILGSSEAICSLSSPDNNLEGGMVTAKKKKRRGKRGVRKGKKQMEGFAGFPLAPGLGPEFAGQPRRRLPKAPSLEIMRGEHDLSEYCLQDEGSSPMDSGAEKTIARDGESESHAWAGDHHARHGLLPYDSPGGGVGDGGDNVLGALGRWQGGGDHDLTTAAATAGATIGAKGVGGRRSNRAEEARDSGEGGDEVGNEQDDRLDGVEGNEEGVGSGSVYLEEECQRLVVSSSGPAAEVSRQVDSAGRVELRKSGHSPPKSETHDDADINSYGFSAVAEAITGRGGEGGAVAATKHVRDSLIFFPETTGDDNDVGGTRETKIPPKSVVPATAKVARKGDVSGYSGDGGMGNRRRSSGVSEEIITAGARALAEATPMKPSAAGNSSTGEIIGFSDDSAHGHDDGGGGGVEGGHQRLGPDEATPTSGGAYAASPAATGTGYGRRQGGGHTVVVDGEPTPRLYGENHETPCPDAEQAGIDGQACSPASVERHFGPDSPNHPTLSLGSIELSEGGVMKRTQMRSDRCENGSSLKEGCATPRYMATVADVQEAFQRADTRVAREAAQRPL